MIALDGFTVVLRERRGQGWDPRQLQHEPLTMSRRKIAELTGKNHENVLADIRNMLEGLGIQSVEFKADYKCSRGRMQKEFGLPKA